VTSITARPSSNFTCWIDWKKAYTRSDRANYISVYIIDVNDKRDMLTDAPDIPDGGFSVSALYVAAYVDIV